MRLPKWPKRPKNASVQSMKNWASKTAAVKKKRAEIKGAPGKKAAIAEQVRKMKV